MGKLFLILFTTIILNFNLNASTSTINGVTAKAKIQSLFTLITISQLNFGTVVSDIVGGEATLTTTPGVGQGNITFTGNLAGAGDHQQGVYNVVGIPSEVVSISLPTNNITVTSSSTAPGNTMQILLQLSTNSVTLNGLGLGNFNIGGTLYVGSNQDLGQYNGTFSVTFSY